jgi:hypothetical protein
VSVAGAVGAGSRPGGGGGADWTGRLDVGVGPASPAIGCTTCGWGRGSWVVDEEVVADSVATFTALRFEALEPHPATTSAIIAVAARVRI